MILLPPTSLLNLGLVSKYWQSLVHGLVTLGCERGQASIKLPPKKMERPLQLMELLGIHDHQEEQEKEAEAMEVEYENAPYGTKLKVKNFDIVRVKCETISHHALLHIRQPKYELRLINKRKKREQYILTVTSYTTSTYVDSDYGNYLEVTFAKSNFVVGENAKIFSVWHLGRIWSDIIAGKLLEKDRKDLSVLFRSHMQHTYLELSPMLEAYQAKGRVWEVGHEKLKNENAAKTLKLHPYQKDAIKWMAGLERDGVRIKTCRKTPLTLFNQYFGEFYRDFGVYNDECHNTLTINPRTEPTTLYGGLLCDDVGLGKTRTMVGLIAENPRTDAFDTWPVISSSQLKLPLQSRATLIVCKNGLAEMWRDELTLAGFQTLVITTAPKQSALMLLQYDVIVVTREVFKNTYLSNKKNFLAQGFKMQDVNYDSTQFPRYPIFHIVEFHRLCLDEAHEMDQFPDRQEIFSILAKNRYYISATPFSNLKQVQNCLAFFKLLNSKEEEEKSGSFYFYKGNDSIGVQWFTPFTDLAKTMLWRSLKQTVEGNNTYQLDVVDLNEVMLDFHPVEQAMYDIFATGYRFPSPSFLRTPTHFQKNQGSTANTSTIYRHWVLGKESFPLFGTMLPLTKLVHYVLIFIRDTLESVRSELESLRAVNKTFATFRKNASALRKMREKAIADGTVQETPLEKAVRKKREAEEALSERQKQQLRENEIRLAEYAGREEVLASHLTELDEFVAQHHLVAGPNENRDWIQQRGASDPNTAEVQKTKTLHRCLQEIEKELAMNKTCTFAPSVTREVIIDRLGTKLGEVFLLIRKIVTEDREARVIVFTTTLFFAKLMNIIMNLNNIPSLIFANSKERVLKKFKSNDVRVLFCDSKASSSGLNLQEAANIIIADTYNYRDAKKSESEVIQIIGRSWRQGQSKKVNVYRMTMRGTMEDRGDMEEDESDDESSEEEDDEDGELIEKPKEKAEKKKKVIESSESSSESEDEGYTEFGVKYTGKAVKSRARAIEAFVPHVSDELIRLEAEGGALRFEGKTTTVTNKPLVDRMREDWNRVELDFFETDPVQPHQSVESGEQLIDGGMDVEGSEIEERECEDDEAEEKVEEMEELGGSEPSREDDEADEGVEEEEGEDEGEEVANDDDDEQEEVEEVGDDDEQEEFEDVGDDDEVQPPVDASEANRDAMIAKLTASIHRLTGEDGIGNHISNTSNNNNNSVSMRGKNKTHNKKREYFANSYSLDSADEEIVNDSKAESSEELGDDSDSDSDEDENSDEDTVPEEECKPVTRVERPVRNSRAKVTYFAPGEQEESDGEKEKEKKKQLQKNQMPRNNSNASYNNNSNASNNNNSNASNNASITNNSSAAISNNNSGNKNITSPPRVSNNNSNATTTNNNATPSHPAFSNPNSFGNFLKRSPESRQSTVPVQLGRGKHAAGSANTKQSHANATTNNSNNNSNSSSTISTNTNNNNSTNKKVAIARSPFKSLLTNSIETPFLLLDDDEEPPVIRKPVDPNAPRVVIELDSESDEMQHDEMQHVPEEKKKETALVVGSWSDSESGWSVVIASQSDSTVDVDSDTLSFEERQREERERELKKESMRLGADRSNKPVSLAKHPLLAASTTPLLDEMAAATGNCNNSNNGAKTDSPKKTKTKKVSDSSRMATPPNGRHEKFAFSPAQLAAMEESVAGDLEDDEFDPETELAKERATKEKKKRVTVSKKLSEKEKDKRLRRSSTSKRSEVKDKRKSSGEKEKKKKRHSSGEKDKANASDKKQKSRNRSSRSEDSSASSSASKSKKTAKHKRDYDLVSPSDRIRDYAEELNVEASKNSARKAEKPTSSIKTSNNNNDAQSHYSFLRDMENFYQALTTQKGKKLDPFPDMSSDSEPVDVAAAMRAADREAERKRGSKGRASIIDDVVEKMLRDEGSGWRPDRQGWSTPPAGLTKKRKQRKLDAEVESAQEGEDEMQAATKRDDERSENEDEDSVKEANMQTLKISGRTIIGNGNLIFGDNNTVYGNQNAIQGDKNKVFGDDNSVIGWDNTTLGERNGVEGRGSEAL